MFNQKYLTRLSENDIVAGLPLKIFFSDDLLERVEITMLSGEGVALMKQNMQILDQQITIETNDLPAGKYTLIIRLEDGMEIYRFSIT